MRAFPEGIRLPLPRTIGSQCLLALVVGMLLAYRLPQLNPVLEPLGQIFLRASQIVVMPYLLCELLGALGGLSTPSMRLLGRFGGLVLLLQLLVGSLLVLWLPSLLPQLDSSGFFRPESLLTPAPPDLIATYLPFNIFTALAEDNFPATVLFAAVLGVVLQGLPQKQILLVPLEQLRLLFRRLNGLVIRMAPIGVLALTATTLRSLSPEELLRSQGLLLIHLVALLVVAALFVVVVVGLTPLSPGAIWRILRGPLALTASSGNLMIALPMLNDSLQRALAPLLPPEAEGRRAMVFEEIAALLPVGFALPTLGQVVSLMFIPFCGWLVDRPLRLEEVARMLLTGIPTVAGGLKAAVRQELLAASLPIDLLSLIDLNGSWLYREEKVLSLLGLVVLVLLVVCRSLGLLRLRAAPLLVGLLLSGGMALGLAALSRTFLADQLKAAYHNDRTLLAMRPLLPQQPTRLVRPDQLTPAPVSLAAIRRRGVLRVGLRSDALPWAYHNDQGQLVGYDIDMLQALARNLSVQLELVQAPVPQHEALLRSQRIDLAAGGIPSTPQRAADLTVSVDYQQVHLALLVRDEKVDLIQALPRRPLGRPLRLAVSDGSMLGVNLRDQVAGLLGPPGRPAPLEIQLLPERRLFFTDQGRSLDGLLTSAEGGSAWAVLYPRTTLLTVFGARLPEQLALLIGGQDPDFEDYINTWLTRKREQGFLDRLYRHWILLEKTGSGPD
jgi:Na+/H+-dicarboxylate symporter/ABC-type amino acid transport substrate-binding protein